MTKRISIKLFTAMLAAIIFAASFVVLGAQAIDNRIEQDLGVSGLISKRESLILKEFSTPRDTYQKQEIPFRVVIANNGNVGLVPGSGKISIETEGGKSAGEVAITGMGEIEPGSESTFDLVWHDSKVKSGNCKAWLEIKYGQDGLIKNSLDFRLKLGFLSVVDSPIGRKVRQLINAAAIVIALVVLINWLLFLFGFRRHDSEEHRNFIDKLFDFILLLRFPIMAAGTFLAVIFYIIESSTNNLGILIIYVLFWLYKFDYSRKNA